MSKRATKQDLYQAVAATFAARQPTNPLTWLPENIYFEDGAERAQFDFDEAPHLRGVIKQFWNDPDREMMYLPWATRLMKTSTVLSLLIMTAATDPCPTCLLYTSPSPRD